MKTAILIFLIAISFEAFADNSVGCGLGSMIFQKNSLISATSRVITNNIFLTQYLGTTTGTSGCSKHSIVMREMAPVYYAEANIENLKIDIAKGDGEYLDAFATTLGCSSTDFPSVRKATRDNYEQIFNKSNVTPYEMLNNVKNTLNNNSTTKGKCTFVLI